MAYLQSDNEPKYSFTSELNEEEERPPRQPKKRTTKSSVAKPKKQPRTERTESACHEEQQKSTIFEEQVAEPNEELKREEIQDAVLEGENDDELTTYRNLLKKFDGIAPVNDDNTAFIVQDMRKKQLHVNF